MKINTTENWKRSKAQYCTVYKISSKKLETGMHRSRRSRRIGPTTSSPCLLCCGHRRTDKGGSDVRKKSLCNVFADIGHWTSRHPADHKNPESKELRTACCQN
jgi:hypothetical protein